VLNSHLIFCIILNFGYNRYDIGNTPGKAIIMKKKPIASGIKSAYIIDKMKNCIPTSNEVSKENITRLILGIKISLAKTNGGMKNIPSVMINLITLLMFFPKFLP
jgi:hypothetical protein